MAHFGCGSTVSNVSTERRIEFIRPFGWIQFGLAKRPETIGPMLSTTLTGKRSLACAPERSVAVQVTSVWPRAKNEPESASHLMDGFESTGLAAVTVKLTRPPLAFSASPVTLDGTLITSLVKSTFTSNEPPPTFSELSVAVQVTVVLPTGKSEPEAGKQLGVIAPSMSSSAVTSYFTNAPRPSVASTEKERGTFTIGLPPSNTVTAKSPVTRSPRLFEATHWTLVVPSGKSEPAAGLQSMTGFGSSPPDAKTSYLTNSPPRFGARTASSSGIWICSVSLFGSTTLKLAGAVSPVPPCTTSV